MEACSSAAFAGERWRCPLPVMSCVSTGNRFLALLDLRIMSPGVSTGRPVPTSGVLRASRFGSTSSEGWALFVSFRGELNIN
jgi:hypothetical protein